MSQLFHYIDPTDSIERAGSFISPWGGHFLHGKARFVPKVDVHEGEKETVIHAEIPGVKKEDVTLNIIKDGRSLVIGGTSKKDEKFKEGDALIHERHFGSFERTVRLPVGSEPDHVKAKFENGLLIVTVPKNDKKTASRIEIE